MNIQCQASGQCQQQYVYSLSAYANVHVHLWKYTTAVPECADRYLVIATTTTTERENGNSHVVETQ